MIAVSYLLRIGEEILSSLTITVTLAGQLIEVPYTRTEKVQHIDKVMHDKLAMPEFRRKRLRQLLQLRPIVKALEVHSGITALIAAFRRRGCQNRRLYLKKLLEWLPMNIR